MKSIVETQVSAPIKNTFDLIVPIDLSQIFTGHLCLPAVIGVENSTGDWDGAGQTRTVCLSDNSRAQETLLEYNRPSYFRYRVSNFTGVLRLLAKEARGQWWFKENSDGTTHIRWEYVFVPASVFALPFIWIVAKFIWRGYMKKALSISKQMTETCFES